MKPKKHKSFKDWQAEEVEKTFGIKRLRTLPVLEHLKTLKFPQNHSLTDTLEKYRLEAFDYIDSWNEDEYKFFFISPFFKLVDFTSQYYKAFTQRPMSVTYNKDTETTSGNVEFMLAKGRQIPEMPHFFLHEYKPENSPLQWGGVRGGVCILGQLLIAMVAAQKRNADEQTIYGIYVNGRNWFFVALTKNQYATSLAFDITSERIFDLFAALLYLKEEMETLYQKF